MGLVVFGAVVDAVLWFTLWSHLYSSWGVFSLVYE